jgi:hypothetical protein
MQNSILINSSEFNVSNGISHLTKCGINVKYNDVQRIDLSCLGKNISIIFNKLTIGKNVNGSNYTYNITIPTVNVGCSTLDLLSRYIENTDIGLSDLIRSINVDNNVVKQSSIDYRNNLLLTSNKHFDIINVMADKDFLNISKNLKTSSFIMNDKKFLQKTIIKSFVNEVMKYTAFNKIKKYNYCSLHGVNNFNILNFFIYETDDLIFVHITCNTSGTDSFYDKYIRGYNFVLYK